MNKKYKIISVSGYGSTGSSAVVDLLKEFDDFFIMGGEFRMIQDPGGLEELCNSLSNSWGWVRSDAYIRRFINYTNIIGRRITPFRYGEHLNKAFNFKFFEIRNQFIDSIVDTSWDGHWFYHDYYERSLFETVIENIKRSLSWHFGFSREWLRAKTKKSTMYFVRSDVDVYKKAQKFITLLFHEVNSNSHNLVFDQLILPYHKDKYDRLFPGLKQIVVDRDPRDVYLDAKNYNAYPITDDINTFISFYESSRTISKISNNDKNLKVQFEDLILNYDKTLSTLANFLKINLSDHNNNFKYFQPEFSKKNTQTWLKLKNKDMIKNIMTIEQKLSKWCYNF